MGKILVVYFSETGNTKKAAQLVAEGAQSGAKHDVKLVDVRELDIPEFARADGYALGSPDYFTYMAGEMKTLFDRALSVAQELKGKPFVSFVSHGGGGGAIDSLDKLSGSLGLRQIGDGVKCLGAPDGQSADDCRRLGEALAEAVS